MQLSFDSQMFTLASMKHHFTTTDSSCPTISDPSVLLRYSIGLRWAYGGSNQDGVSDSPVNLIMDITLEGLGQHVEQVTRPDLNMHHELRRSYIRPRPTDHNSITSCHKLSQVQDSEQS